MGRPGGRGRAREGRQTLRACPHRVWCLPSPSTRGPWPPIPPRCGGTGMRPPHVDDLRAMLGRLGRCVLVPYCRLVTFQRTRAQGPAAEQRHALTRGVGVALDGAWRHGMVRPPVVPLLAWWATDIASAICPYANRQQHLRRRAGGVQGPQHRPRLGRTHERGVLPFHGRTPVARSPYSYENSFLTQESYGYAVVSRKILAQTRPPPALRPKPRFPVAGHCRYATAMRGHRTAHRPRAF